MARFAERCRWLRVQVVIHGLTIVCVLEAVGATFGVMPQVSAFPGENHLLLIAGAFAWIRALVMLVISAVVRDTSRPKGEQALKHLPRWSGVIGPLCTVCELLYWLFHARYFAAGRFLAEALCYLMAAINVLLALPLLVFTTKVIWDGHAKVTPKLSTLTDPATQLGEDISCTICLNDMTSGDLIGELPCGHIFHAQCINEWLAVRPRCPLRCAKLVNPSDLDQVQAFGRQGDEPEQSPSNPTPGSNSSLRRADLEFGARLAAQAQVSLPGATAISRRSERPSRASEPEFSNVMPQTVGAPSSLEPELSGIMPHAIGVPSSPEPELSDVISEPIGNPSSPA